MNWEVLHEKKCPYCSNAVSGDNDLQEVRCTVCSFKISQERLLQILKHRRVGVTDTKKMFWQNLHNAKCPVCSNLLVPMAGRYAVLGCLNSDCGFKIREDRMQQILADNTHAANKFNKQK